MALIYGVDEMSRLFPPQEKALNEAIQKRRKAELDAYAPHIGLAIGIIIMLGSIFAILAAHQILPGGLNTFTQLHAGSYVIGYGLLVAGFITALVSAVRWGSFNESKKMELELRAYDVYSVKIRAFQEILTEDEMLLISIPESSSWPSHVHLITKQCDYRPNDELNSLASFTADALVTLRLGDKNFTTPEVLQQRVQAKGHTLWPKRTDDGFS